VVITDADTYDLFHSLMQLHSADQDFDDLAEAFSLAQRERMRGGVLISKASAKPIALQQQQQQQQQQHVLTTSHVSNQIDLSKADLTAVTWNFEGHFKAGAKLHDIYQGVSIQSAGFGWFRGRNRGDPDSWRICGGDGSDAYGIWGGEDSVMTFDGVASLVSMELLADCGAPPSSITATFKDADGKVVDSWSTVVSKEHPIRLMESKASNVKIVEWKTTNGHAIDNIHAFLSGGAHKVPLSNISLLTSIANTSRSQTAVPESVVPATSKQ